MVITLPEISIRPTAHWQQMQIHIDRVSTHRGDMQYVQGDRSGSAVVRLVGPSCNMMGG